MARDPRLDRPSLDPDGVAAQTFASAFRGFDPAEVRRYLEVVASLLRDAASREEDLARRLADAEERLAAPPALDEHQLTMLLGEETTRVIETARQAAVEIRARAEENAARVVREADEEASATRSSAEEHAARLRAETEEVTLAQRTAADDYASRVRAEADDEVARLRADAEADTLRMREEATSILATRTEEAEASVRAARSEADQLLASAAADAESLRSSVAAEVAGQRAEAAAQAEAEKEAGRQEGRAMVAEARAVRERMLADLADRRRAGRSQLDQLKAARQDLLASVESTRSRLDDAAASLAAALPDARNGTDRIARQDADDDALLAAMSEDHPATPSAETPEEPGAQALTEPEVEPIPVAEPAEAAETGDSAAAPDPFTADPADDPSVPAPSSEGGADVDALFAKIRASRADEVVVAVAEGRDPVSADVSEVADPPGGPSAEPGPPEEHPVDAAQVAAEAQVAEPLEDDRPEGAENVSAEDPALVGGPDPIASLLERRDAATDDIERQLARRLKRILSDEQNELLDQVRRGKGVPTAEASLPEAAAQAGRYAEAATADLIGAAAAGAAFYGDPPAKMSTKVEDIAERLADELVRQLRARLTRCFTDAEGDEAELGERIRACYREWKTQRIADTSRHFVLAAFTRGLFDAAPSATAFQWIVDDGGTPCPDAEDNALQGEVRKGDPFPTGDAYPPAHPGCRCLIVPVEVAVAAPS